MVHIRQATSGLVFHLIYTGQALIHEPRDGQRSQSVTESFGICLSQY